MKISARLFQDAYSIEQNRNHLRIFIDQLDKRFKVLAAEPSRIGDLMPADFAKRFVILSKALVVGTWSSARPASIYFVGKLIPL